MSLVIVLGPALASVAAAVPRDVGASVIVRDAAASPGDRAAALRKSLKAGADTVLIIDTAIAVRPDWAVGGGARFALIADHLNLTGGNPLVGVNDDGWGPRFPDLTDAWDPGLRHELRAAAARHSVLREGVVATVATARPTSAEFVMLRSLGADMVATGFADEAIIARHAGRRVAGIAVLGEAGTDGPDPGGLEGLEALLAIVLPVLNRAGSAA